MRHALSLPGLLPLDLPAAARLSRQVELSIMGEGRAAFDLGWPVTSCPPFKHPDHARAWRQGWRNAQAQRVRKCNTS